MTLQNSGIRNCLFFNFGVLQVVGGDTIVIIFRHIWSPNIKVSGLGDSEKLGKGLWFKQYPWDAHCSVWFTQRKKSQIQCQPQSPGPFGRVLRLKWYSALSVPGATSHLHSATTFWGSLWNWGGSLCHSGTCPSSFIPVNLYLKKTILWSSGGREPEGPWGDQLKLTSPRLDSASASIN